MYFGNRKIGLKDLNWFLIVYIILFILILASLCFSAQGESPTYTQPITSFNAGQVSPLLEARSDFQKYGSACRTLENMLVLTQGPATRRPGTKFINEVKDSNYPVRLIPFEYSTDDTYVIETGNDYMRFFRDGGRILDPNGDAYEISTVFLTDELFDVQYAQSENLMYLVCGNHEPQKLTRLAHSFWVIEDVNITNGPFMPENTTTTTITPSGTSGSITLTADANIFNAGHIGSIWEINQKRGTSTLKGTLNADGNSADSNSFTGGYSFTTRGTWDGTLILERSTDSGATWNAALAPLAATNFDNPSETEDDVAIYRVRMEDYHSGHVHYNFTITDQLNHGIVKITDVNNLSLETLADYGDGTLATKIYEQWKMNDTNLAAGITATYDANNNGTVLVSPSYSESTEGKIDKAIKLLNTYIDNVAVNHISSQLFGETNPWSISAWIKINDLGSTFSILNKGMAYQLRLTYISGTTYRIDVIYVRKTTYINQIYGVNANFEANKWYHIVGMMEPGTPASVKIYLDNVDITGGGSWIQGDGEGNAYQGSTGAINIGCRILNSGIILDNVCLFDDLLTATEVSQLYETDATQATANVIVGLENTDSTTRWCEGYWSDYRGWPKTVEFCQQRLIFGGSESFPQTLWFGECNPDNYEDFAEGTLDTSSFTAALPGQNPICWMKAMDYLIIGTSGSVGKYGEQGKAITPTSPNYQEQSRVGCASIPAVKADGSLLFVERGNRKVREMAYSLQYDKYLASDLTLLAENITESGIKDIAFQRRPEPILWCVLDNGYCPTLTYQREQEVIGWANQTTLGDFESVVVEPSNDDEDNIWVSVKRVIEGQDKRYIELFAPRDWGDDANDCWFVDSGLKYDSTDTSDYLLAMCQNWWKFEESAANFNVDDYMGNAGGLASVVTSELSDTGKIDNCFRFDASNSEYVSFDKDDIGELDNFTISLWFKLDSIPSSASYRILSYRSGATATRESVEVYVHYDSNEIRVDLGDGTNTQVYESTTTVDVDTWYHVAFTRNENAGASLYVNNVVEDNNTLDVNGTITPTNPFYIGKYTNAGIQFFDGFIDDVRIYNDALTTSQINFIYSLDVNEVNDFTGIEHLAGRTVSVYEGGIVLPNETIDANTGDVSVDRVSAEVLIGLPYTSKLETLPLIIDPRDKAMDKKINALNFDFYETGYCKYGNGHLSELENINFSNDLELDPNATPQTFWSSEYDFKRCAFPFSSMKKATIYIEVDKPMPMTIRAIIPELVIYP